ncbi:hypothetical protein EVU96_09030 [Bacillus infantis]|uniref:hypothetical protein n=1 Tax=Bacillus infantis TaxID=324767 RepID=UPI00101DB57D|nr:hypothetical protein [Bacillus infantis]RYI30548.1 hypothetical protein EVU96_09030 [Bacillus infantis]
MQKWVVDYEDINTVKHLESLGLLSYVPMFHEELKFVFIKTDMTKEQIMKIKGITNARKEYIGHLI